MSSTLPLLPREAALELDAPGVVPDVGLRVGRPGDRQAASPDGALCAACEAELFDRAERRDRYPFTTCTDCGPRVVLVAAEGRRLAEDDRAIATASRLLRAGAIVAVPGLGGFHLAVDATSDEAVARLRRLKRREAKPLAVMVRSLQDACSLVCVTDADATLLASPERPIVVLRARENSPVAAAVATGLADLGVMLACTPLHHLLLDAVERPLVMTSGNPREEPIATGNAEAMQRLGGVADAFLFQGKGKGKGEGEGEGNG